MRFDGHGLSRLLRLYAASEPNRARGGIVALSGLELQVWSYLASLTRTLAAGELARPESQFDSAYETLSDYTRVSGHRVICVQVKLSLDRTKMAQAAVEFAAIERFFARHPNALAGDLPQYEVVSRTQAADLPPWTNIELPTQVATSEPDLVGYFSRLKTGDRLLAPRLEADPQWATIAAVYRHLEDPFGFARRAFELCLRRTMDAASADFVRNEIAEAFSLARQPRHSSRVVGRGDFERAPDGQGTILAKTPTLADLRCGRFMARPERLGDLLLAIRELGEGASDDAAIPLLWIDGRSGSGKSVLLLQLMETLVVDRDATAVWITGGAEGLGTVIEQILSAQTAVPDFVFVDDVYDPQARDDLDLPRLTKLIVHGDATQWPIVVTCGPTEFRQHFEHDCRGEGFRVVAWHLKNMERAETLALRGWFEQRTGRPVQSGPAAAESHALMISVMMEMTHGSLKPFAQRFRAKLASERLEAALLVPLALNRLYIWTPRQWFNAMEVAGLEAVSQDGDFSVLSFEAAVASWSNSRTRI